VKLPLTDTSEKRTVPLGGQILISRRRLHKFFHIKFFHKTDMPNHGSKQPFHSIFDHKNLSKGESGPAEKNIFWEKPNVF
jgi:hypothetical protein